MRFAPVLAAVALLTSACFVGLSDVDGNGDIETETRDHSGFDAVSLSGIGDVTITEGDYAVSIRTDANLMEYVETSVRGNTLVIEQRDRVDLDPTDGIEFTVSLPELTAVDVSGVGQITMERLDADDFKVEVSGVGGVDIGDLTADSLTVDLSGVGGIDIAGEVTDLDVESSGVGAFEGGDLETRTAVVDASGVGSVTLWVTDSLDLDASGIGSVSYYGSPSLTGGTSGLGNVTSLGGK